MNGSGRQSGNRTVATNAQGPFERLTLAEPSSSVGPALDSRTYSVVGYHFGLLSRKPGFESWYVRHQSGVRAINHFSHHFLISMPFSVLIFYLVAL